MARTPASPMPAPAPMQQSVAPPGQPTQRRPSLLEAIAAASASFGDLTKDSKNDYLKSAYLGLPGLLKAIKPPLLEQGVILYSQVMLADNCWVVRTTLASVDGSEELFSDFPIPDASNQQRIGAVVTYGTRYNLFALLAICPDSDDDNNGGAYGAPAASSHALPGLPSSPWQPPAQQPVAMPGAVLAPVQPLPVLQ